MQGLIILTEEPVIGHGYFAEESPLQLRLGLYQGKNHLIPNADSITDQYLYGPFDAGSPSLGDILRTQLHPPSRSLNWFLFRAEGRIYDLAFLLSERFRGMIDYGCPGQCSTIMFPYSRKERLLEELFKE